MGTSRPARQHHCTGKAYITCWRPSKRADRRAVVQTALRSGGTPDESQKPAGATRSPPLRHACGRARRSGHVIGIGARQQHGPRDQAACSECREPLPSNRPECRSPTIGGVDSRTCVATASERTVNRRPQPLVLLLLRGDAAAAARSSPGGFTDPPPHVRQGPRPPAALVPRPCALTRRACPRDG
jgi:hypothetical protein